MSLSNKQMDYWTEVAEADTANAVARHWAGNSAEHAPQQHATAQPIAAQQQADELDTLRTALAHSRAENAAEVAALRGEVDRLANQLADLRAALGRGGIS